MNRLGSGKEGAWIAFVGIDGSGKSTQANLLQRRLSDSGYISHSPESQDQFGSSVLRNLAAAKGLSSGRELVSPDTLEIVTALDMLRDICLRVRPLCATGAIVIQSRSTHRRLAAAMIRGVSELSVIESIVHFSGAPDLTFWLDISVAQALERVERRGKDREDPSILHKFKEAHASLAEKYSWRKIDGSQSVATVHEAIWHETLNWLNTNTELLRGTTSF